MCDRHIGIAIMVAAITFLGSTVEHAAADELSGMARASSTFVLRELTRLKQIRCALTRKADVGPAELLHAIAFHSILQAVSSCAQRAAKIAMGEC